MMFWRSCVYVHCSDTGSLMTEAASLLTIITDRRGSSLPGLRPLWLDADEGLWGLRE
jgi:hypothetical protein